jgi:hypothetical protein
LVSSQFIHTNPKIIKTIIKITKSIKILLLTLFGSSKSRQQLIVPKPHLIIKRKRPSLIRQTKRTIFLKRIATVLKSTTIVIKSTTIVLKRRTIVS